MTQNGVPFFQPDELTTTYNRLKTHFADCGFYCAPIPTYYGGFMSFGWATDNAELRNIAVDELQARLEAAKLTCRYYNTPIHKSAFALPQYMLDMITKPSFS